MMEIGDTLSSERCLEESYFGTPQLDMLPLMYEIYMRPLVGKESLRGWNIRIVIEDK